MAKATVEKVLWHVDLNFIPKLSQFVNPLNACSWLTEYMYPLSLSIKINWSEYHAQIMQFCLDGGRRELEREFRILHPSLPARSYWSETDRQMDRRMDRHTDGRSDRQTDRSIHIKINKSSKPLLMTSSTDELWCHQLCPVDLPETV